MRAVPGHSGAARRHVPVRHVAVRQNQPEAHGRLAGESARWTRSPAPDDPDRDLVALLLADCHGDRSWRVRYGTDLDVADRARDVEDLLVELSAIVATGHHPTVTHYLRLLTGMAQLERYSYEPD